MMKKVLAAQRISDVEAKQRDSFQANVAKIIAAEWLPPESKPRVSVPLLELNFMRFSKRGNLSPQSVHLQDGAAIDCQTLDLARAKELCGTCGGQLGGVHYLETSVFIR